MLSASNIFKNCQNVYTEVLSSSEDQLSGNFTISFLIKVTQNILMCMYQIILFRILILSLRDTMKYLQCKIHTYFQLRIYSFKDVPGKTFYRELVKYGCFQCFLKFSGTFKAFSFFLFFTFQLIVIGVSSYNLAKQFYHLSLSFTP